MDTPVYLCNKPSYGLGKIQKKSKGILEVYFSAVHKTLELPEEDENLRYLNSTLSALHEFESRPYEMFVSLLAMDLKLTHVFDKLSSLSNSRTRLLPHQLESTYYVVNSLRPRFILADEVGLGKTIEASLVMKELMFRNNYTKVLVIAPSPLLVQWKHELKNKFNEDFTIIKRRNFVTNGEENWKNFKKVITSIDFIKNPVYAEEILKTRWNIVVFDEAHRLRRDYSKVTKAYLFAEKISKKCECLLLLTATPFRGKLEELFYLMHLVDPNILGSYHAFVNDYVVGNKQDLKEKISKVLLRRRKVEVGGFTKRFAKTVKIELSDIERQFYDETTEYVKREYNIAMNTKNRATGFVMIVFQKLLDSSVFALLNALTRRKFMIESRLHRFTGFEKDLDEWDIDDTENVEEFIAGLDDPIQKDIQSIRRELLSLNRLIMLGKSIKEDRKSIKLKEILLRLKRDGSKKFIIFTQFRNTQDYLTSILQDEFQITPFHGSLSADEKENAIAEFKERSEVLICTEAGGEGRNLQFSNILINYDLPWSPLKIEQRIGRIHRFGQKKDVYIFNFASKDTVAERILEVLNHKIKLFEDSIGASDALLGTIEDELDFNSSFMKFVTGTKTTEELNEELDNRIKIAEKGYNKLNSLVTPKLMDFNLQDYYDHTLSERAYTNSHLEEMLLLYQKHFGDSFPYTLKKKEGNLYEILEENQTAKIGTFDSELALANDSLDFLAFGHPTVERCIQHILENKLGYKKRYIHNSLYSGKTLFVFLVEFQFSLKRTELFYLEYNREEKKAKKLGKFPEELRLVLQKETNLADSILEEKNFETELIHTLNLLEQKVEKRERELQDETLTMFKKEEYKIELSSKKNIRLLEEKLSRQEAQAKWDPEHDRRGLINRTKNEIQKAREEMERKLREVRNGSRIKHRFTLFQVYYGR
ncbi:MAG: DEAD/DEAH box helicase family protein [Leptospiraceae bacterium]|nr:DEAD/DEAH box helicase family protein [Leptospiraceae bacterium]